MSIAVHQYEFVVKRLLLFIAPAMLLLAFTPAKADSEASVAVQQINAEQDPEYDGLDVTRPENKFETRFEYRTSGTANQVTRNSTLLRLDQRFNLEPQWKLGILTQLPFVARETTSPTNPNGEGDWGLGDAFIEPTFIRNIDPQWSIALGARFVAPTAGDTLGTGKWQAMPLVAVRYQWAPDTYFVPLVRYAVSVAGDPLKRNISELQFAPTLNIGLPDHWFLTLYPSPDIRINYGGAISGQTGRLFLPADVLVGRQMGSNVVLAFEVSAPIIKDYPVYNLKTELRMQFKF